MKSSKPEIKIKKVDSKNFDDFIFLINALAEYEKLKGPDANAVRRLKKDCQKKYFAYLGYVNGKAMAYTIFFYNYSSFLAKPTLYIEDIFILKEYRQKGYGQKMFDFVFKEAKKNKSGMMQWCVLQWNKPAIKFYEKMKAKRLLWFFYQIKL
jgi:GNAT superfamily N-acetyltransferase